MATIHKGENELKEKAKQYFRLAIIFLALPVIYIIAFLSQGYHFEGIYHLLPGIPLLIGSYFWNKYSALRSGIKGEEQTENILMDLPSDYDVFTSKRINTAEGNAEYDHIIVGENGIFVVEVKNHNGTIVGDENEHQWTQHKVGRKGGQYTSRMRNPVKQVKRQVFILSTYLKQHEVPVWIEGIVFFSNPRARIRVQSSTTPVFHNASELSAYLKTYTPKKKLNQNDIEKAKKVLMNL